MEIPVPIKKQITKKGGLKRIACLLADDEAIVRQSKVFQALSEPLRLKILNLLSIQSLCVCIIKEIIRISDSKLSYHLSKLKDIGLINGVQRGNWIIYSISRKGRKHLSELIKRGK